MESFSHFELGVTAELSTLLLLKHWPFNFGQILKPKEWNSNCTLSKLGEVRRGSQMNVGRDQESQYSYLATAYVRSIWFARRSSSWTPPITQDPFHYFISHSVKMLIWKEIISGQHKDTPKSWCASSKGGQNHRVLVFQSQPSCPLFRGRPGDQVLPEHLKTIWSQRLGLLWAQLFPDMVVSSFPGLPTASIFGSLTFCWLLSHAPSSLHHCSLSCCCWTMNGGPFWPIIF